MTYAEHLIHLDRLIATLHVAQESAAHNDMRAAALTINKAREELIRDRNTAREYADEKMAHGQEIA